VVSLKNLISFGCRKAFLCILRPSLRLKNRLFKVMESLLCKGKTVSSAKEG